MKVNVRKDYGLDLSNDALAKKVAHSIAALKEVPVILDLSQCIIDYESTSIVIDAVLERLLKLERGDKKLTIQFNIRFPERQLIRWLFIGSVLLELKLKGKTLDTVALRNHVNSHLKRLGLHITLDVKPKATGTAVEYKYGDIK